MPLWNEVHRTSKVQRTLTHRCGASQGCAAPCTHTPPCTHTGHGDALLQFQVACHQFSGRLASPCQTVSVHTGLWDTPLSSDNKVHRTSKVHRTLTCRCGSSQGCAAPGPTPHLVPTSGMGMPYLPFRCPVYRFPVNRIIQAEAVIIRQSYCHQARNHI